MKGFRLRNIVALFLSVLLGASVLMAHVWKQNAYVRLSKESVRLDRERKALRDTLALLELEVGELRNPARLEALARGRFGLEYGIAPVLVYPGGEGDGAVARRGGDGREALAARAEAGTGTGAGTEGRRAVKDLQRSIAGWLTRGL